MTQTLLDIQNLTVNFKDEDVQLTALDSVNLSIPAGKTLCLVGESGCGKSVTAKAILRVLDESASIESGTMNYSGKDGEQTDLAALDARSETMRTLRGDEIAMIYQEPMTALSPLYTIGNQIVEALRWHRTISKADAKQEALKILEQVGMPAPEKRFDAYSFELSGGQRQRAMIAMALVCRPRLLIADEPTTALDVTTQAVILDLLRDLQKKEGMSMLFITHDLGVVAEIADEVAVMYMGKVVEKGSVEQILTAPRHPYTQGLIASLPSLDSKLGEPLQTIPGSVPHLRNRPKGCPFASRCAYVQDTCRQQFPAATSITDDHLAHCHALDDQGQLPTLAATGSVDQLAVHTPDYSAEPILRLREVQKHFAVGGGLFKKPKLVKSLNSVSFDLWPGETLGLVGESGCGKSTLGQTIIGLHEATNGSVELNAQAKAVDLTTLSAKQIRKHWRDLRMVFQDPNSSFNPRMTVFDIIAEVLRMDGEKDSNVISQRVDEVMSMVGLDAGFLDRYPHAFSGGQRQRIGIARALAPQPRIIIADEAVSALDVSVQAQVLNLLKTLQAELGLTYIFISHDLSVVKHISDRVAVMYAGEIVEIAPAEELFANPRHPYTQALLGSILPPVPRSQRNSKPVHLPGAVPDPSSLPPGCKFASRCIKATEQCQRQAPTLDATGYQHSVACFYADADRQSEQTEADKLKWQA